MADVFLRKTLNVPLGPKFVNYPDWFLCEGFFVNRIAIFDYNFVSIHGERDPYSLPPVVPKS